MARKPYIFFESGETSVETRRNRMIEKHPNLLIGAAVLSLGLIIGALLFGFGVARIRQADRFVTVKGVSERDVVADIAIWPIGLVASDDDLGRAHAELESSVAEVKSFLSRHGIDPEEASVQRFTVSDAQAELYRSRESVGNRYIINETLVVRSGEPDKVMEASAAIGELVSAGVVLTSGQQYGAGGPTFVFKGLNELKPEMIAEATARAREAAEQFAQDSGSRLGGIRRANQGVFVILPRDRAPGIEESSQVEKTVRVVSTVEYLLVD
jgi:hypothetical protein